MADLPIEMWHLIFDHLQLVDLSPCAQVSKAVYLAVKAYRIREIAFTGRVHRWFHYTTPTTDHKHWVDFMKISILKSSPFNFDYLKRLKIGQVPGIDLEEINKFTRLEELDIDLKSYKRKMSRILSLANLKVLYLFIPDHLSHVTLDTPQLAKVCTCSLKRLEFIYSDSVRCIHTFFSDGKLSMFRNLEYLTLTDCYNQVDYPSYFLSQNFKELNVSVLKKLKEIDFYYYLCPEYPKNYMNNFKSMTADFLAMGRPDLKVFWHDVQVTDPNLLTEYERSMENVGLLAFQLQHYEMLREKIDFSWYFDFNESMRKLSRAGFNLRSEEFTSKFLARYSFRRISVTGQVEERELLLELIARSPDLFVLVFGYTNLDQSFFHRMADIIQLNAIPLQQLQVVDTSNGLNFYFVTRLRDLEWFETNSNNLRNGLISRLLDLPMLAEIRLGSRLSSIISSRLSSCNRIERLSRSRFRLNGKSLSLHKLLEHFQS